jgi:uncharacterized membrane protein
LLNDHFPHRFVFLFGLLFGGGLVFITPPFSVPDELAHFLRAYHCSQGKLYATNRAHETGDDLPASLCEIYRVIVEEAHHDKEYSISWAKLDRVAGTRLEPARQEFTVFSNTALYSPVAYLPQSLVIWAARCCELPPLKMLYLARFANLIVYLALAAAAVRLTPIHKWTLAMTALIPMSIYLAASLSADAMTLGLSLAVVAWVLRLALESEKPGPRELLALGILMVLLVLAKQAYFGLALLFFLIPGSKFSSRGRRWQIAALVIGAPLAIEAAWAWSLRGLYVPIRPFVDPPAQFRSILNNPWSYTATLFKAIFKKGSHSAMIGLFGWLGPHLPHWIRHTYWAALGLTAFLDGGKPLRLDIRTKVVACGIYVFTAAGMATLVYLSWEQVGNKNIDGMQPRYFLPILPLLLLPFRGSAKLASSQFSRTVVPIIAMAVVILAAIATWFVLAKRYYW